MLNTPFVLLDNFYQDFLVRTITREINSKNKWYKLKTIQIINSSSLNKKKSFEIIHQWKRNS